jgi:multiple sugar transport system permease protein
MTSGRLMLGGGVLFFLILIGLPFWWVVTGSVKEPAEIIARQPTMFPRSFTWEHYAKLLASSAYPTYLANSLIVAVATAMLTVGLALPAAYAFFRMDLPFREGMYRAILLAYAFPGIIVLIPIYGFFAQLGLIDSLIALIIVNTTFALPFSIWMMRSFLATIPQDIEDAARMDGAPTPVILRRILVPLLLPGIAAVAVFAFISSWTEYIFASVLILSDEMRTIPVGFAGIIGQYQIDWGLLLAGASLAILPVVLIFALIGRAFVAGMTDGAVK